MSLELTDATGSGADLVRVSVRKVDGPKVNGGKGDGAKAGGLS